MALMLIRMVAAAKGIAVGVPTLFISAAGELMYIRSNSRICIGTGMGRGCNAGLTAFGIELRDVAVLFVLVLALGPLLAWGFLLPRPALYLIAPFVAAFVDIPMRSTGLPKEFLLVAPFAAYPVIAALSAGRRRTAPRQAPDAEGLRRTARGLAVRSVPGDRGPVLEPSGDRP
jgi:hypothetical protein